MATRKRNDVKSALTRKGFTLEDGDHHYYFFTFNGQQIVRTKVSHGSKYKDLADPLLGQMARQCHLSKNRFLELIDCPLSQQDYERILQEQGHIE
jgi:hypothetical protein